MRANIYNALIFNLRKHLQVCGYIIERRVSGASVEQKENFKIEMDKQQYHRIKDLSSDATGHI